MDVINNNPADVAIDEGTSVTVAIDEGSSVTDVAVKQKFTGDNLVSHEK